MSKLTEVILGVLISGVMGILLAFVGVNFILGCETWDESLWTYEHSCLTPTAIWEGVSLWLNNN